MPYEPGVTTYRVFRLNPDGSVGSAEILDARSDDEAMGKARVMANMCGIDLWERSRYLASYPRRSADEDV